MREARASARLQHPSIATFHEAGEVDGEVFLALEYVEGEMLRARLARGPLAPAEAIAIACALLDFGLARTAHALGRTSEAADLDTRAALAARVTRQATAS